jgi:hypothetical protein
MSLVAMNIDDGDSEASRASQSKALFRNFILFCLFYSIAHGCVDSVLAYSSAELGTTIGSYGGFSLYITYAFSCLLMAKPALRLFDAKRTVLVGLTGILIYVTSFFVAVAVDQVAMQAAAAIFIVAAACTSLGQKPLDLLVAPGHFSDAACSQPSPRWRSGRELIHQCYK